MTMKIQDPNDPTKTIEVFTPDEVKAQVDAAKQEAVDTATAAATKAAKDAADAAIEQYKKDNPDKTDELEKLKDELATAQASLEQAEAYGGGGDDKNRKDQIERLRKERDEKIDTLNKTVEKLTNTVQSMQDSNVATMKSNLLDKYGGTDAEKRKLVEVEFNKYDPTNTTPEGMESRMKAAAAIVGVDVQEQPGAMDGGSGADARGDRRGGDGTKKPTENAVAIGQALGVSEEELTEAAANGGMPPKK